MFWNVLGRFVLFFLFLAQGWIRVLVRGECDFLGSDKCERRVEPMSKGSFDSSY